MAYLLNILVVVCMCSLIHSVVSQFGFPSYNRKDRRFGNPFTQNTYEYQTPQRVHGSVASILHLQPEGPDYNRQYVLPERPNNYQQQYYSNSNNQPPYQTYQWQRPSYQNEYHGNSYPNRPQWNYNQNTGQGDVIVVVEEVTESPKSSEINQEYIFEDRYNEVTTKAASPNAEVGSETNEGSQQQGVTLPSFSPPPDGLPQLAPAGTQSSSGPGGLSPLAPAGTLSSSDPSGLPPLSPGGTLSSRDPSELPPLSPGGTLSSSDPSGLPPLAPAGTFSSSDPSDLPALSPGGTLSSRDPSGLPPLSPAGTLSSSDATPGRLKPLAPAGIYAPDTMNRGGFNYATQGPFQDSCDTPDGGVGSCVSITQCDPYIAELKMARSNPGIVLKLRRAHCGFEGNNPKVCCPRRGLPTNTPPPPVPVTESPPPPPAPEEKGQQPKSGGEEEAPPELPDDDQYVDRLPEPPVCGSSNASFSRVVGGVPAKLGDFPWLALLGYRNARLRDKISFLCGGSIITKRHVLTAAHCYHSQRNKLTLVRLGELDLGRTDEGATPIDINIKRVIEHDGYNPNTYLNDIAVLLLEQLIPFTDLIKPICLPRSVELRSLTFEKYTPLIAGWGELQWHGEQADVLQVVQLPVTSNEYCKKAFAAYKAQVIDDRVLCAGYEKGNKDACRGDSGGPLMQPIWDSVNLTTYFYQIGVVSFGKKCAEPGFPGVYSRVTAFMPWIEKVVLGHTS